MPEEDFHEQMLRLERGDDDAAAALFQRYSRRLVALARSRLDSMVRQKVDPEDVLQSVMRSFFVRHANGDWTLENSDSLWSILSLITLRKCNRRAEYFRAARRDVRREVSPSTSVEESRTGWEAVDREPTPDEAAMLAETVEQIMERLDERDRKVLEQKLQGLPVRQISYEMGCTERTIERRLTHIRNQIQSLESTESGPD